MYYYYLFVQDSNNRPNADVILHNEVILEYILKENIEIRKELSNVRNEYYQQKEELTQLKKEFIHQKEKLELKEKERKNEEIEIKKAKRKREKDKEIFQSLFLLFY
jgi:multidrug resistance efflux pump